MPTCDVLIVGGGPAGSACARTLTLAGWKVIVIDRARFPRHKVCAGWITPEVFDLLEVEPETYRAAGLVLEEITGFRTSVIGGPAANVRYRHVVSYAIRRCEFDHYLLQRSGASVREGTPVVSLTRRHDRWIVNESLDAPVLVGAGGHFCPVARRTGCGSAHATPVIAQAAEFLVREPSPVRPDTPELFFSADMNGYGWCLRKGDYLNVGIGRRHAVRFRTQRDAFVAALERGGRMRGASFVRWRGHAYFAAGAGTRRLVDDGVLLVGDAAGLAYPESGEGIRPAVESGLAAARALIDADGCYSAERLGTYAEVMRRQHPPVRSTGGTACLNAALGRALLGYAPLARRVVLDRWFLRRHAGALSPPRRETTGPIPSGAGTSPRGSASAR